MRVVATAGHVDHGKSSLVLALTGTDPDRFPEEKARGLTIDLGFAFTTLPSGEVVGFVDVPIVFLSTTWWQLQHPGHLVFETGGLAPSMLATLMVSLSAFTCLFFVLLIERVSLKRAEAELRMLMDTIE